MQFVVLTYIFLSQSLLIGQKENCGFASPVRHKIISSGSFGEPRSAHFHGGIDIKTYLGEGKDPVLSVGEGFVSRIRLTPDSYGKTLYIDHPCGYTSVYAHLDAFNPEIDEYIDKVRVATQQSIVDQKPPPNALRVEKGELIGFIGNSGTSFGAHLHFEIRHTESEVPLNPVIFGIAPKDKIAPVIRGLVVYYLDQNRNVISQSYHSAQKAKGNSYELTMDTISVNWPLIGFGLHVFDMSNGARNHNGIHKLQYLVNGDKKFSFSIDSVPFDKSIFLHAHMDYGYKKQNRYVHKCYKENNNSLDIYTYPAHSQLLIPNSLIADHIKIVGGDIFGNSSTLEFHVVRNTHIMNEISTYPNKPNVLTSDTTILNRNSFKIKFKPETFLHPEFVQIDSIFNGLHISTTEKFTPFFKSFELKAELSNLNLVTDNLDKLCFITVNDKGEKINIGASIKNDTLSVKSNDQGLYQILEDNIPPRVTLINNDSKTSVALRIKDNFKTRGSQSRMRYSCLLDGQWVPMDYDEKNDLLTVSSKWLKPGQSCEVEVLDFNQNKTKKIFVVK